MVYVQQQQWEHNNVPHCFRPGVTRTYSGGGQTPTTPSVQLLERRRCHVAFVTLNYLLQDTGTIDITEINVDSQKTPFQMKLAIVTCANYGELFCSRDVVLAHRPPRGVRKTKLSCSKKSTPPSSMEMGTLQQTQSTKTVRHKHATYI